MTHPDSYQYLLELLEKKYAASGQDLGMYLDGLLRSKYLMYWDYVQLDTLLSLQKPRTDYPDEKIFIIYHQITELYFNLILHELEQTCWSCGSAEEFLMRIERVVRYFKHLEDSFEIMIGGMDLIQFREFRTALAPASGFQTAQYRMIEIYAAPLSHLVFFQKREALSQASLPEQLDNIYWNAGGVNVKTMEPTFTALAFKEKYHNQFLELATRLEQNNLWKIYKTLVVGSDLQSQIENRMRDFDAIANINWPLTHLETAKHYLQRAEGDSAATGGTNWKHYLSPENQKVIYYPELWSESEKQSWGKTRYQVVR
jgi:tryptophan 2,3-dioxygenase